MEIDKLRNNYDTDNFGVENTLRYHGDFDRPYFFDTPKKRMMDAYSPKLVHLRSIKNGIIFQFKLCHYSHFYDCLLITSTAEDTVYLNAKNPDIDKNLQSLLHKGRPYTSKTAYNGIVTFGKYNTKQWEHLKRICWNENIEFTPQSLRKIVHFLREAKDEKKSNT